jgi:alpha-D-xyloside xylohydrolase
MDATEPENDALVGKQTAFGAGEFYRLTYPLFVSKAVYDGQRETDPSKRVTILTRSAFPGQQRFGTINWSGDIGWNWDTYKRQIVAGLNFSLTGMPYWTTDIGGFFRPGRTQYTDKKYHDILLRWFQWSTFAPIFRMHGYQTETEPWKYGDTVMNNMRVMMNMRYRLMPYIYSEAWQTSKYNSTIMRPLVMDFPTDSVAYGQAYQYMFGKSMLVAPVTAPDVTEWDVYLPKATSWYDFWTKKKFNGGQTVKASAIDRIPVFVKAGSVIPMADEMQYTSEKPLDTLNVCVYPGADGSFTLYSDEGDNYNYEKGKRTEILFNWDEKQHTLTINKKIGDYAGALKKQVFNITWADDFSSTGNQSSGPVKSVVYRGEKVVVNRGK